MNNQTEKNLLVAMGILLGILLTTAFFIFINRGAIITGAVILEDKSNRISDQDLELKDSGLLIKKENLRIISQFEGTSMEPQIGKNTTIIISKVTVGELKIGDIILYKKEGMLVTHRISSIGKDNAGIYFITQGDNNLINDGKIRFEDIEGVVIGILY